MTLYQPFLDWAIALLKERFSLKPYPIPKGFDRKVTTTGKGKREETVITTSHAFKSSKLRQIRAAHVQGGNSLQVLNFVIFPQLNYDLPFFGADLVTLPGGHLIALDMQPLFHDEAYRQKYSDPILPTFKLHQEHLPWGGDFPDEAKPFFSPVFLWTRPEKTEVVETRVFDAFKDYLRAYLDFVDGAEVVSDRHCLEEIKDAQLRYINYRAAKDPARGMFTRFYGEEWTEEYIHGFLFDLERSINNEQLTIMSVELSERAKELIPKSRIVSFANWKNITSDEAIKIFQQADDEGRYLTDEELEKIKALSPDNSSSVERAKFLGEKASEVVDKAREEVLAKYPNITAEGGELYPYERAEACWRDFWHFLRCITYGIAGNNTDFTSSEGLKNMRLLYEELRVPLPAMICGLERLKSYSSELFKAEEKEAIAPYFDSLIAALRSFQES